MIDIVKRFFSKAEASGTQSAEGDSGRDLRVAVCALFLEMARIGHALSKDSPSPGV